MTTILPTAPEGAHVEAAAEEEDGTMTITRKMKTTSDTSDVATAALPATMDVANPASKVFWKVLGWAASLAPQLNNLAEKAAAAGLVVRVVPTRVPALDPALEVARSNDNGRKQRRQPSSQVRWKPSERATNLVHGAATRDDVLQLPPSVPAVSIDLLTAILTINRSVISLKPSSVGLLPIVLLMGLAQRLAAVLSPGLAASGPALAQSLTVSARSPAAVLSLWTDPVKSQHVPNLVVAVSKISRQAVLLRLQVKPYMIASAPSPASAISPGLGRDPALRTVTCRRGDEHALAL